MYKTAILVDGGFYRKRAFYFWGDISPELRAEELRKYCQKHITNRKNEERDLYRIFYYDCRPIEKKLYHPFLRKQIDFEKSDIYLWTERFFKELSSKRKFALRLGVLDAEYAHYNLKPPVLKKILDGKKNFSELTQSDFQLYGMSQKLVDMKIGIDIATLAYQRLVDQIILISGDSDFVPASKLARIHGIDFILDNMRNPIKQNLLEHIDGIQTYAPPVSRQEKPKKA